MNGKLMLELNSEYDISNYDITACGTDSFDFVISINTDLSTDFKSLISNSKELDDNIDETISFFECSKDNYDSMDLYLKYKNKGAELLQNTIYVSFSFDISEVYKYIELNPILKTKKIIFDNVKDLDIEVVNKINSLFGDNTENLYFDIRGNYGLISFKEYSDSVKTIDNMIKDVSKYNLSPLEKIMYVYDIARNRVYTEVLEGEDKSLSRSLSSVLLGDKIVCVGFATIFNTLLDKLGITARIVILTDASKESGHARSEIYIKDEKYDIDGVYYFDPTWDCKKDINDNSYLLKYKYFAMTKNQMNLIDKGNLVDSNFTSYSSNLARICEKIIDKEGFSGLSQKVIKTINHMSVVVDGEELVPHFALISPTLYSLLPEKDKFSRDLTRLVAYFNKPLSANTLLKVLYNVRKIEYYNNPQKYQFDIKTFYHIAVASKWKFEETRFEELLLQFDKDNTVLKNEIMLEQLNKYNKENDLERNIEQVKLAKVLRLVYEKKNN